MGTHLDKLPNDNPLVQPLHTAVKGRARYRVNGLYGSQALKKYLELRLSQEAKIAEVRANNFTGNILVIFNSSQSPNAIASLIQDIVLDYRIQGGKSPVRTTSLQKALEEAKNLQFQEKRNNFIQKFKLPSLALLTSAGLSIATGGFTNAVVISGIAIANVVIGYAKSQMVDSAVITQTPTQRKVQAGRQLAIVSGVISSLVFGTFLMHISGLDAVILLAIQRLHTPFLDTIMLGITSVGNPPVLLLICLGLAIGPLFYKRGIEATSLGIAAVGALGLNYWLKILFARARPALWDWIIHVGHHSFPSGHAMGSMVIYGFLAYVLAKQFPQWRRQIFASMTGLIIAIGFSRLYLGVHWPTDVAAGYAAGLVWLIACIIGMELWQKYRFLGGHSQAECLV
ncbi:phosphatase PAP2 family protein [Chlorogloeopsis sp. ULAP01]|uniref:phosphatase PAP2 family protein n=1 Tax=Chlorogloeopsis sp. ULAP01 TaxID=3056483 RepID=UPI0025AA3C9B|nr:phosphatase PAP2 family protein [Chlorogloeopsis sp. ULAP01]MDM9380078.1 phosphatase PAP2 family protein [Chlorogloeopsis sp. ULAP01]